MKYAISCILTLLTAKTRIVMVTVSQNAVCRAFAAHTPGHRAHSTPSTCGSSLPRLRLDRRSMRFVRRRGPLVASARYSCLTLLRETTVVWSCEIQERNARRSSDQRRLTAILPFPVPAESLADAGHRQTHNRDIARRINVQLTQGVDNGGCQTIASQKNAVGSESRLCPSQSTSW